MHSYNIVIFIRDIFFLYMSFGTFSYCISHVMTGEDGGGAQIYYGFLVFGWDGIVDNKPTTRDARPTAISTCTPTSIHPIH